MFNIINNNIYKCNEYNKENKQLILNVEDKLLTE